MTEAEKLLGHVVGWAGLLPLGTWHWSLWGEFGGHGGTTWLVNCSLRREGSASRSPKLFSVQWTESCGVHHSSPVNSFCFKSNWNYINSLVWLFRSQWLARCSTSLTVPKLHPVHKIKAWWADNTGDRGFKVLETRKAELLSSCWVELMLGWNQSMILAPVQLPTNFGWCPEWSWLGHTRMRGRCQSADMWNPWDWMVSQKELDRKNLKGVMQRKQLEHMRDGKWSEDNESLSCASAGALVVIPCHGCREKWAVADWKRFVRNEAALGMFSPTSEASAVSRSHFDTVTQQKPNKNLWRWAVTPCIWRVKTNSCIRYTKPAFPTGWRVKSNSFQSGILEVSGRSLADRPGRHSTGLGAWNIGGPFGRSGHDQMIKWVLMTMTTYGCVWKYCTPTPNG